MWPNVKYPHSCPFCAIIAVDAPATITHGTETMVCILDSFPVNDGHALLLPREHIEHVGDLDATTLGPAPIDAVEAVTVPLHEPIGRRLGLVDEPHDRLQRLDEAGAPAEHGGRCSAIGRLC